MRLYTPSNLPDATPPTTSETAAAPAGPSNLRQRVIYGLIGAAMLLGSVWFSPWTFGLFFAFVQTVMLWEFYRMMRADGYAPATWIGVGASIILFGIVYWVCFKGAYPDVDYIFGTIVLFAFFLLACLIVVLVLREISIWPNHKHPFINISTTVVGILYVSLPMSLLIIISHIVRIHNESGYDYRRIFALLFLVWASDIGAYAAGKTFGKHKMAPKISPGKTWEGWAGGFLLTLIVGWALGYLLPDRSLTHRLVAAGVVAVFAPLGDLAESMLKRSVGVKDSGRIMPGHGGLLDRFDAFLLVLPVLALLQLLFN